MISNDFGYLFTGTRCFLFVSQIDLWYTDENVRLTVGSEDKSVLLDEEESRVVRRWHELAMQATVSDMDDLVIRRRIERQEQINKAEKLNRTTARKQKKKPAMVVNIETWKSMSRPEVEVPAVEPCTMPAA